MLVRVALAVLVAALSLGAKPASAGEEASERAKLGAVLYRAHCQACHGKDGAAPIEGAKDLRAFAGDEAAFAAVVRNGRNLMPAHPYLTPDRVAAIYAYVHGE